MSRRRAPVIRINMQLPFMGASATPGQVAAQGVAMKQFVMDHIDEINRILELIQNLLASSDDPKFKYLKDLLAHFKMLLGMMYPSMNGASQDQTVYAPSLPPPPVAMEPAPPASKTNWKEVMDKLQKFDPNTSDMNEDWGGILKDIQKYVKDRTPD